MSKAYSLPKPAVEKVKTCGTIMCQMARHLEKPTEVPAIICSSPTPRIAPRKIWDWFAPLLKPNTKHATKKALLNGVGKNGPRPK